MNQFAPFKAEGIHEFWIEGFKKPIIGRIENIEFYETKDEVKTFLTVKSDDREYRVALGSVSVWSQIQNEAA